MMIMMMTMEEDVGFAKFINKNFPKRHSWTLTLQYRFNFNSQITLLYSNHKYGGFS